MKQTVQRTASSWVAFYFEDFRQGVAELSMEARGLYMTALCHQWSHGSIPDPETDQRAFCRALGCFPEDAEKAWPEIREKFVANGSPGRLVNLRAKAESMAREEKRQKAIALAGRRWSDPEPDAKADAKACADGDASEDAVVDAKACSDACANGCASTSTSTSSYKKEGEGSPPAAAQPAGAGPPGLSAEEFVQAWNDLGGPFPQVRRMTGARARALRARSRDAEWLANWRAALQRLQDSPFCRGENGRNWVATVDFFLRPETADRLLEGAYATGIRHSGASDPPKLKLDTKLPPLRPAISDEATADDVKGLVDQLRQNFRRPPTPQPCTKPD